MIENRKKTIELFEEFLNVVKENDIWYALTGNTLLGAIRHGGFVPWEEKITVMMTEASYEKLKVKTKDRVADSSNNSDIKTLAGYFVKDSSNVVAPQPFIEIKVLVPTSVKKIKKLMSPLYPLKNSFKSRKTNIKNAINDLKEKRFEGYLALEKRGQDINKNWVQSISFETVTKSFISLKVSVPKEYARYLATWYGEDYMTTNIPSKINEYISPVETIKESI